MDSKNHYLAVAAISLMLGLMVHSCLRKQPVSGLPFNPRNPLPSTDTLRIGVKGNTIQVQTPTQIYEQYVPEEGKAIVDVKKDGTPIISVANKGLTSEFGGGILYADKLRISLDWEFAFWNRFGTHLGLAFNNNPVVVAYAAVSYQLDQLHLSNTSIFVGKQLNQDLLTNKGMVIGVRVRF